MKCNEWIMFDQVGGKLLVLNRLIKNLVLFEIIFKGIFSIFFKIVGDLGLI